MCDCRKYRDFEIQTIEQIGADGQPVVNADGTVVQIPKPLPPSEIIIGGNNLGNPNISVVVQTEDAVTGRIASNSFQSPFFNWADRPNDANRTYFINRKNGREKDRPFHYFRRYDRSDPEGPAQISNRNPPPARIPNPNRRKVYPANGEYCRNCLINEINTIVLHDTGTDLAPIFPGWVDVNGGAAAHFLIMRNGAVVQFNDVMEIVPHGGGFNRQSIGIEFAHNNFSQDTSLPAAESGTEVKIGFPLRNLYVPAFHLLEIDCQLVKYLVDTARSGLTINDKFLQAIERPVTIRQVDNDGTVHHPIIGKAVDWLIHYRGRNSGPSSGHNKEFFSDNRVRNPNQQGIISHGAYHRDKVCGWSISLYCWLRMQYVDMEADSATSILGAFNGVPIGDNRGALNTEEAKQALLRIAEIKTHTLIENNGWARNRRRGVDRIFKPIFKRLDYRASNGITYIIKLTYKQDFCLVDIWEASLGKKYCWLRNITSNNDTKIDYPVVDANSYTDLQQSLDEHLSWYSSIVGKKKSEAECVVAIIEEYPDILSNLPNEVPSLGLIKGADSS